MLLRNGEERCNVSSQEILAGEKLGNYKDLVLYVMQNVS